ncbi:MAG: hypothetical protein V4449_03845 [Patescibacteria group bacterium]
MSERLKPVKPGKTIIARELKDGRLAVRSLSFLEAKLVAISERWGNPHPLADLDHGSLDFYVTAPAKYGRIQARRKDGLPPYVWKEVDQDSSY